MFDSAQSLCTVDAWLCYAGVVQYLTTGHMEFNHKDFCDIGYQDSLQKMSTTTGKDAYTHNFRLSQAYSPDMLACTNFTLVTSTYDTCVRYITYVGFVLVLT